MKLVVFLLLRVLIRTRILMGDRGHNKRGMVSLDRTKFKSVSKRIDNDNVIDALVYIALVHGMASKRFDAGDSWFLFLGISLFRKKAYKK